MYVKLLLILIHIYCQTITFNLRSTFNIRYFKSLSFGNFYFTKVSFHLYSYSSMSFGYFSKSSCGWMLLTFSHVLWSLGPPVAVVRLCVAVVYFNVAVVFPYVAVVSRVCRSFLCVAIDAGSGREMPGQSGMFQRGPEGRLGTLAEQQETRLQADAHRDGWPEHDLLREGTKETLRNILETHDQCENDHSTKQNQKIYLCW